MKPSLLTAAASLLLCHVAIPLVSAIRPPNSSFSFRTGMKVRPHPDPDRIGNSTFEQPIDHDHPDKGTFQQRYWWDAKSWKGPGSPVFVFNPGEAAADNFVGYLDNGTMPGLYADTFGGAVIVIEHRFWGKSIPYEELTAKTMQDLNIKQAALDMTNFAKNVPLEFDDTHGDANAAHSPWVLIGGSYSGALSAWTSQIDPGTFYAYHASSAVVQAVYRFWEYFAPVERALPRSCSADVHAVVSHIDETFAGGSDEDIHELKALFGLEALEHSDDFAAEVASPLWAWQGDQKAVFDFCNHLETFQDDGDAEKADEKSQRGSKKEKRALGPGKVLHAYADYVNKTTQCHHFDCNTYNNPESYNNPHDLTSGNRQWDWLLCDTPFGWWQAGPPPPSSDAFAANNTNTIVSSLLTAEHFQRQCPLKFPETDGFVDGSTRGFTADDTNRFTGGWSADFGAERVLFCNGQFDPWRAATVSSEFREGGPLASTHRTPVFVVENGVHVPDLIIGDVPAEMDVIDKELDVMKGWLNDYYRDHHKEGFMPT